MLILATTRNHVLALAFTGVVLLSAAPARAATLQQVEQSVWGVSGLPSYVNMYIYVPDQLAAKPPIVVGAHYCTGTATAYFGALSTVVAAANSQGFILIFPEATGRNCWDVGSTKALTHDGLGDTHAIAQMVRYTLATYDADATRVYVIGSSSGAMMTQALLGVYPDIFKAGAEFSGVPCGCWSVGYSGDNGQWSSSCATGQVIKTGPEWGDLVRSMYPGYTGHRPRIQLWHGTADDTINYANFLESIKEFTNLLGLSESPTATETPRTGYNRQLWNNSCGFTVIDATSIVNGAHNIPLDGNAALKFFGLDAAGGVDPEVAACPGDGGAGGATGSDAGGGSAPPPRAESDCGCRTANGRSSAAGWLGALGLLLLGRTRHRDQGKRRLASGARHVSFDSSIRHQPDGGD